MISSKVFIKNLGFRPSAKEIEDWSESFDQLMLSPSKKEVRPRKDIFMLNFWYDFRWKTIF